MQKPTIYLDTSLLSAYWYEGHDEIAAHRRLRTRDWWRSERIHFECHTSHFTENELADGVYPRQRECLAMCRRLKYCPVTSTVTNLWNQLRHAKIVPENKPIDGWQLALAIEHEIDYLLSWNLSHLANPDVQMRLGVFCAEWGLGVPWLVSPDSIPQVRFGQVIRRRKS